MMPAQVVTALQSISLEVLPFSHVEESKLKEFRKTAEAFSQPPWGMLKAQSYMLSTCAPIESGQVPNPTPLNFVFSETPIDDLLYDATSVTQKEDIAVRKIRVAKVKGKAKCLKRPSASTLAGPARKKPAGGGAKIHPPLESPAHHISVSPRRSWHATPRRRRWTRRTCSRT